MGRLDHAVNAGLRKDSTARLLRQAMTKLKAGRDNVTTVEEGVVPIDVHLRTETGTTSIWGDHLHGGGYRNSRWYTLMENKLVML